MATDISESELRDLDPAQVRWYAVQAGWKPVLGVKRPVILLNHPHGELTQLQIPLAGNERERTFLMRETVQALAAAERRPAGEVLADLAMPPADVLSLRVDSPDVSGGSLPLDEGVRLLTGGRDLLLAAACSAHHVRPLFPRLSFKQAEKFMAGCRLGQTERGSFVATIIAPILPPQGQSLIEPDLASEPYERRVTLMLMDALQLVRGALDRGRPDEILQGVHLGISANLLEALASMSPVDVRANLQVGVNWSRTRPRLSRSLPGRVNFTYSEFPWMRETGRRLRESLEPRRERVEGPILSLHAEPVQLFEAFQGQVTIKAMIGGRVARVRFALSEADYASACHAHGSHRTVAVTGVLQRDAEAKFFDLAKPHDFQVLAEGATP